MSASTRTIIAQGPYGEMHITDDSAADHAIMRVRQLVDLLDAIGGNEPNHLMWLAQQLAIELSETMDGLFLSGLSSGAPEEPEQNAEFELTAGERAIATRLFRALRRTEANMASQTAECFAGSAESLAQEHPRLAAIGKAVKA